MNRDDVSANAPSPATAALHNGIDLVRKRPNAAQQPNRIPRLGEGGVDARMNKKYPRSFLRGDGVVR